MYLQLKQKEKEAAERATNRVARLNRDIEDKYLVGNDPTNTFFGFKARAELLRGRVMHDLAGEKRASTVLHVAARVDMTGR